MKKKNNTTQKNIKFTAETIELLEKWKDQGLSYQDTVNAAVVFAFNHPLFETKLEAMKLKKALKRSAEKNKENIRKRGRRKLSC